MIRFTDCMILFVEKAQWIRFIDRNIVQKPYFTHGDLRLNGRSSPTILLLLVIFKVFLTVVSLFLIVGCTPPRIKFSEKGSHINLVNKQITRASVMEVN